MQYQTTNTKTMCLQFLKYDNITVAQIPMHVPQLELMKQWKIIKNKKLKCGSLQFGYN